MTQPVGINITIVSNNTLLEQRLLAMSAPDNISLNIRTCHVGEVQYTDILIYDAVSLPHEVLDTRGCLEYVLYSLPEQASPVLLNDLQWTAFWSIPLSDSILEFYLRQLIVSVQSKKELAMTRTFLNTLIDSVPDLIWFKDLRGAHLKVNDAFCSAVGKTKAQCEGRGHYYIWDLKPDEYAKGEYVCLETEEEVIRQNKTCLFDEKVKSKNGLRQFKTYKSPLADERGEMFGTVGIAKDVTNEHELQHKLLHSANTDFLTHLYNRRYFYEAVSQNKDVRQVSFVYFDLDDFKKVNDTYGHQSGDNALVLMSELLLEAFPDQLIARLGGDEFVVAFSGFCVSDELAQYVKTFIEHANSVFQATQHMEKLTVSAGIACNGSSQNVDALLSCSDKALYAAKALGKACYTVYEGPI